MKIEENIDIPETEKSPPTTNNSKEPSKDPPISVAEKSEKDKIRPLHRTTPLTDTEHLSNVEFSIISSVYFSFLFGSSALENQTLLPIFNNPIIDPVFGQ